MIASERKEFLEIVIGFAELKGKTLSAPALELFWNSMRAWSLDDFRTAANQLIRTFDYMPTPKQFEDLRKAWRETPAEAWNSAREFLRWGLHGYTLDAKCPAKIATCLNALGGANTVAMCDEDKLPFLERRFCEHYETLEDAEDTRSAVPQLADDRYLGWDRR
jgi:hypothetical protein